MSTAPPSPFDKEALFQQASTLHRAGNLAGAQAGYEAILGVDPQHFGALHLLGVIDIQNRDFEKGVLLIQQALRIHPQHPSAWTNLGVGLTELFRLDEALTAYHQALQLKPDYPEAWSSCGVVYQNMNRLEEALACQDKALAIQADNITAHTNRGSALFHLRRLAEAEHHYRHILEKHPQHPDASFGLSLLLLAQGKLAEGFALYELRWKSVQQSFWREFSPPAWSGRESLQDKTLLLYSEQGFGDMLQVLRYIPLLAGKGARIILELPLRMHPLVRDLPGIQRLLAPSEPIPPFDYHCALMSLPLAFGTTLENIPIQIPYLYPNTHSLNQWRSRLGKRRGLRIGIVWSGSPTHKNDRSRTLSLAQFLSMFPPGVELHSLQKEVRDGDIATLNANPSLGHYGESLTNFADTAALISLMDLIIGVDTGLIHLTGALGKPVWVLMPFNADWRWLIDREDSPWYPTLRLFRQTRFGHWDEVLQRIRQACLALLYPTLKTLSAINREAGEGIPLGTPISQGATLPYQAVGIPPQGAALPSMILSALPPPTHPLVVAKEPALGTPIAVDQAQIPSSALIQQSMYAISAPKMIRSDPSSEALLLTPLTPNKGKATPPIIPATPTALATPVSSPPAPTAPAGISRSPLIKAQLQKAVTAHQSGSLDTAVQIYQSILDQQPDHCDALHLLGLVYAVRGKSQEAIDLIQRAIALNPQWAIAYSNLYRPLGDLERYEEGLMACDKAIALQDNLSDAWYNRGNALLELQRLPEAIQSYDRALRLQPNLGMAWINRGNALREQLRYVEAIDSFKVALSLDANDSGAHQNLAICFLTLQNFPQGWEEYEWRWQGSQKEVVRSFQEARWTGEQSLDGKTILIFAEQGMGDTLQMLRYLPLVAKRAQGAPVRILLEIQGALGSVLRPEDGRLLPTVSAVFFNQEPLPAFDYQCPMMSLPRIFKTDLTSIPPCIEWVWYGEALRKKWQQQIQALNLGAGLRIGLAWAGKPKPKNRSIPLRLILQTLPWNFVVLLNQVSPEDQTLISQYPERIHFLDEGRSLAETAALMVNLDLIITIDTSIAHLAGNLDVPTCVLLAYRSDWRWLLNRSDNPWYSRPNFRLFRQTSLGDWASALLKVRAYVEEQFPSQKTRVSALPYREDEQNE